MIPAIGRMIPAVVEIFPSIAGMFSATAENFLSIAGIFSAIAENFLAATKIFFPKDKILFAIPALKTLIPKKLYEIGKIFFDGFGLLTK